MRCPPNFGAIWNNPSYWKFNPDNAPPAWINYFTSQKLRPPQTTVNPLESVTTYHGGVTYISSTFSIENPYSVPWQDIYLVLNGIPKNSSAAVQLTIYRPDGSSISIGPLQFSGSYIDLASSPQVENQILSFFSSKGETITLAPTQSPIPLLFQTVNNGKIHPPRRQLHRENIGNGVRLRGRLIQGPPQLHHGNHEGATCMD